MRKLDLLVNKHRTSNMPWFHVWYKDYVCTKLHWSTKISVLNCDMCTETGSYCLVRTF